MTTTTLKQVEQSASINLMTTELNTLTNGSNAISSVGGTSGVFNNVVGTTNLDGNPYAKVELFLAAYSGTPSTGGSVYVWFLFDVDGTDYENGGASVTPARNPDLVIPVNATASGPQRITKRISIRITKRIRIRITKRFRKYINK